MRHLESQLQIVCVKWFRYAYTPLAPLLFAVPNGGKRNVKEAAKLRSEGVRAGVSDLILLCPSRDGAYHSLCLEMKTERGRQTELQKAWQIEVEKQGNKYVVCRSLEEFMDAITEYLCREPKVKR